MSQDGTAELAEVLHDSLGEYAANVTAEADFVDVSLQHSTVSEPYRALYLPEHARFVLSEANPVMHDSATEAYRVELPETEIPDDNSTLLLVGAYTPNKEQFIFFDAGLREESDHSSSWTRMDVRKEVFDVAAERSILPVCPDEENGQSTETAVVASPKRMVEAVEFRALFGWVRDQLDEILNDGWRYDPRIRRRIEFTAVLFCFLAERDSHAEKISERLFFLLNKKSKFKQSNILYAF